MPRSNNPFAEAVLEATEPSSVTLRVDPRLHGQLSNLLQVLKGPHSDRVKKLVFERTSARALDEQFPAGFFDRVIVGRPVAKSMAFEGLDLPDEFFDSVRFEGLEELAIADCKISRPPLFVPAERRIEGLLRALARSGATITKLSMCGLPIATFAPFRGNLAPLGRLVSLDLSRSNFLRYTGLVDMVLSDPPELPPTLTTITFATRYNNDVSELSRLFEGPAPRTLEIQVCPRHSTRIESASSLPCLTVNLKSNYDANISKLFPQLCNKHFASLAELGELTWSELTCLRFQGMPSTGYNAGLYLMDEDILSLFERQNERFPDNDVDHLYRVPASLVGRLSGVVRPGRPFLAEVLVPEATGLVVGPDLRDLGRALATASSVEVQLLSPTRYSFDEPSLLRSFPSEQGVLNALLAPLVKGERPAQRISLAITPTAFFEWEPAQRSLSMAGVSAEIVEAVVMPGSLLLGATEKLTITCEGLDVAAVVSKWAGMVKDGTWRGLEHLVMEGQINLSLSTGQGAYLHTSSFSHLGNLVTDLASCFKITSFFITITAASLETVDLGDLGRALPLLECPVVSISGEGRWIPPTRRWLADLVEPLVNESLFNKARVSIKVGSDAWLEWAKEEGQTSFSLSFSGLPTECTRVLAEGVTRLHCPLKSLKAVLDSSVDLAVLRGLFGFESIELELFKWSGGPHRSLEVEGLHPPELSMVADALSRGSIIPDSLTVQLAAPSHLSVGDDLLRVMIHTKQLVLKGCNVLQVLSGLERASRFKAWQKLELRNRGFFVSVHGERAFVYADAAGAPDFPTACTILCHAFGVVDLTFHLQRDRQSSVNLPPLVATLSSLPIRSLTVQGRDPGWAVDVVRPGPGPLRTLMFSSKFLDNNTLLGLQRLLGPNESLVTVLVAGVHLDVGRRNFRLLSGSKLSDRNKRMRRALASLLSALPGLNTQDIPLEIGFAIRRVQARTTAV